MRSSDWCIIIFTLFHILIIVADFIEELNLFVHVLALQTELLQKVQVGRVLVLRQRLQLINLSCLNFLAELICEEHLMEFVCADRPLV